MDNNTVNKTPEKAKKGSFLGMNSLRYGTKSIIAIVIVVALVFAVNYVFTLAENNFAWSIDLSTNKKFSISDTTRDIVKGLDQDIKIYTLLQENSTASLNAQLDEILNRYEAIGDHIKVANLDVVANPTAAARFQTDNTALTVNSIVVSNADETKFRVITQNDMYDIEYGYDQQSGSYYYSKYEFIGERMLTSAIQYVSSPVTPKVYFLQGHNEPGTELLTSVVNELKADNYDCMDLNLADSSVTLEPGNVIMVIAPQMDLSDTEYDILSAYLADGGRMYYCSLYGAANMPNFESLLSFYGLTVDNGIVLEDVGSTEYYYRNQISLMPKLNLTYDDNEGNTLDTVAMQGFEDDDYVVLYQSQAIRTPEMKQSGIQYYDLLSTSDKAYIKSNITESTTVDRQPEDETGKFAVAVAMNKPVYMENGYTEDGSKSTRIVVVGNAYFIGADTYFTAYDNKKLLISPMDWLVDRKTNSVYVSGVSVGSYNMTIPDNTTYQILSVTVIIAMPLIMILLGLFVWMKRRHL